MPRQSCASKVKRWFNGASKKQSTSDEGEEPIPEPSDAYENTIPRLSDEYELPIPGLCTPNPKLEPKSSILKGSALNNASANKLPSPKKTTRFKGHEGGTTRITQNDVALDIDAPSDFIDSERIAFNQEIYAKYKIICEFIREISSFSCWHICEVPGMTERLTEVCAQTIRNFKFDAMACPDGNNPKLMSELFQSIVEKEYTKVLEESRHRDLDEAGKAIQRATGRFLIEEHERKQHKSEQLERERLGKALLEGKSYVGKQPDNTPYRCPCKTCEEGKKEKECWTKRDIYSIEELARFIDSHHLAGFKRGRMIKKVDQLSESLLSSNI